MNELAFLKVSKAFGEKQVLKEFTHAFGDVTCIMGESGSGKTTLLNLALGLLQPDSGRISGVPKNIAAVFQEDRLSEPFSAVANIKAVLDKDFPIAEIEGCLTELGLGDSMYKKASELSGGMKRRVAIARALLKDSRLIVFDEPFKGLDDATRERVISVILARTKGKTLIFATHDVRDPSDLSASVLTLNTKH